MTYAANGMIGSVTHRIGSSAALEKWDTATGTQELWSTGNYEFEKRRIRGVEHQDPWRVRHGRNACSGIVRGNAFSS
jgi:hypothetical protein